MRFGERWALFERKDIFHSLYPDNGVMLTRFIVVMTPPLSLYVHHHHRPDADRDMHDHPWSFVALIFRGWYVEERMDRVLRTTATRRPRLNIMRRDDAHRIAKVSPGGCWSVLLVGRKQREWGFLRRFGRTWRWTGWRDYFEGELFG